MTYCVLYVLQWLLQFLLPISFHAAAYHFLRAGMSFIFFWVYLFSLFLTEYCFNSACLFLMSAFLCLFRLFFSIEFTVQDRQVMAVSCPFMPVPRTLDFYSTVPVLFWDKAGRSAALLFSEQLLIQRLCAPWRKGEEKMKRREARDVNWRGLGGIQIFVQKWNSIVLRMSGAVASENVLNQLLAVVWTR